MELTKQMDDNKIQEYSKTSLVGGILVVFTGFGFGLVNIALMLITIISGAIAFTKNQGRNKKVANYCMIGMGLIVVSFLLSFFMNKAPVDHLAEILTPALDKAIKSL